MTEVYSLNQTHPKLKNMQRCLNETLGLDLKADGNLGKITQANLKIYQSKNGIVENDKYGPCYGPITQEKMNPYIEERFLQDDHVIQIANLIETDIATVKTVTEVEAKEFGFLNCGFPVVLFERHLFYRYIEKKYGINKADELNKKYPDLCNNTPGGYKGGKAEKDRFLKALSVDEYAAIHSTSFGLFQILGMNFKEAGYSDIYSFYERMKESELNQVVAFMHFVKSNKSMYEALKNKDWAGFARRYNGPGYKNHTVPYDKMLSEAYQKHTKVN